MLGLFIGRQHRRRSGSPASETSRGLQYLGLGLAVVVWSFLLQPMIWVVMPEVRQPAEMFARRRSRRAQRQAAAIIVEAAIITLAIFIGLTVTVFLTKKDFSFMRGVLSICTFAALGMIVASIIFGFHLGALFSGRMILLMAGYILYQTSLVMSYFPPDAATSPRR